MEEGAGGGGRGRAVDEARDRAQVPRMTSYAAAGTLQRRVTAAGSQAAQQLSS